MKKLIMMLILFGISISSVYAQSIHGLATGDNLNVNFDSDDTDMNVNTLDFKSNVCGLGYSGFEISGTGDTDTAGYIQFKNTSENACSAIVLSGSDWYMMGTGKMTVDDDATIKFDNIKLNYNSSDKKYYFDGEAITSSMGTISNWDNVYMTGLSMIDWSKTTLNTDNCNNAYANGTSCNIIVSLKDQSGNPIQTLASIDIGLQNIGGDYNGYVFLGTDGSLAKNVSINSDGEAVIPVYIIKPGNNISFDFKFNYILPDTDGNNEIVKSFNIGNVKSPLEKLNTEFASDIILGQNIKGKFVASFGTNIGAINNYILSGGFILTGDDKSHFEIKTGYDIHSIDYTLKVDSKELKYSQDIPIVTLAGNSRFVVNYGTLFGGNKKVSLNIPNIINQEMYFRGVYINGLANKITKTTDSSKNSISKNSSNFYKIYNQLKKKSSLLVRGLDVSIQNPITYLDGGIKYYKCDSNEKVVLSGNIEYNGQNTLIIENCRIFIKGNLIKDTTEKNASLTIFAYSKGNLDMPDSIDWLTTNSTVYIAPEVSDIQANILTRGSIFSINSNSEVLNTGNIILDNRIFSINDKQLYINGTLLAKNTIGGGFKKYDGYEIGGGKKISGIDTLFGDTNDLSKKAQVFDLNFFRGFKFTTTGAIDNTWYSGYCKNNIDDEKCKYATIIDYDSSIRNNVLFK